MLAALSSWAVASELAGLPGLPGTVRGILMRAERDGWLKRKLPVGKGFEFHIGSLSDEARAELNKRRAAGVNEEPDPDHDLPVLADPIETQLAARWDVPETQGLKQWQREIMDARAVILREVARWENEMPLVEAVQVVMALAKDGTLPPDVQAAIPFALAKTGKGKELLSASTIHRWRAAAKLGAGALAPAAMDAGETPVWANPFLKYYRTANRLTVPAVIAKMQREGVDPAWIPSYSQARRYLARIGEVEANRGRVSRLQLTAMKPFTRRDTSKLYPFDIVNGDGHLSYMLVEHPNTGKPTRLELTELFDVATRMHVGWSINYAESTKAVMDALRMAVEFGGVPKVVHWDNGSGAKNKNLQDEVSGLKKRLGFEFYHQTAGNPQAGGIVERGHQQVFIPAARTFESYVGRRDKDDGLLRVRMKAIREGKIRLPTIPEVVRVIDALREEYNNRPHRSLPKTIDKITGKERHETPVEAWKRHVDAGWKPVKVVDSLEEFRLEEVRHVIRGEIRFHKMFYANNAELAGMTGQVRVRFDPRDGSRVWVYSLDKHDRFICEALRDGNRKDYLVDSVLDHAEQIRLRGQLARLDRKKLEKQEESRRTLELVREPERLTVEQQETANRMSGLPVAEAADYTEMLAVRDEQFSDGQSGGRPIFSGPFAERDWGVWAMGHIEELDEEELDRLEASLEDPRFRMLVGVDGADAGIKRKAGSVA
ncbi:hypothetical protein SIID45300_01774 [Candidatus Magnetaquicoccaceae bacterium FCR-1]|uniref:Transposase n=1 Tax=Candidatus Magnetaquiglobus chichijimensis TaxID=3141448 RepID=A0ABQ0C993_9PROT